MSLGVSQESNVGQRSEEHTSELQSPCNLVCRLLLEKKKKDRPIARVTHPPPPRERGRRTGNRRARRAPERPSPRRRAHARHVPPAQPRQTGQESGR